MMLTVNRIAKEFRVKHIYMANQLTGSKNSAPMNLPTINQVPPEFQGGKLSLGLGVAAVAIGLDQLSKWAVMVLLVGRMHTLIPSLLDLDVSWNRGISFSLIQQTTDLGSRALVGLAAALIISLLILISRSASNSVSAALGMILGGAVGNVVDRVRFGAVLDFLHVHAGATSFFICNGADVFISLGVLALIGFNFSSSRAPQI